MRSAVLDDTRRIPVRPQLAAPRPVPPAAVPAAARLPLAVAAAGALAVLDALGVLALGLTSLDGVFGAGARPSGGLVAVTLLLLAGWVVLAAGGGASLVDGAGRTLLVAVSCGEIALLAVLGTVGLLGGDTLPLTSGGSVPLPALALLALAVPTGKLLLAGAPSAQAWVAAGGRPRTPRPVRIVQHRALRGVTVACIGLALTGVALLGTPADPASSPSTAAVTGAR